jgi:hypothetical protein
MRCRRDQEKYCAPLAEIVDPLMKPASSEARNTTRGQSPRVRPAGRRDLRDDLRIENVLVDRAHHLSADIAGADGVGGDAGARAFLREGPGKADVTGLGSGIVDLTA